MATIHISEAEASLDLPALIERACAGERVFIAVGSETISLAKVPSGTAPQKTLSGAIRLAKERNLTVLLDDQFERDLEQVICNHEREGIRDPWAE